MKRKGFIISQCVPACPAAVTACIRALHCSSMGVSRAGGVRQNCCPATPPARRPPTAIQTSSRSVTVPESHRRLSCPSWYRHCQHWFTRGAHRLSTDDPSPISEHDAHGVGYQNKDETDQQHCHCDLMRSVRVISASDVQAAHFVLQRRTFQTKSLCRAARAGKFS